MLKLPHPQQAVSLPYPMPFICSFDSLEVPWGWGGSAVLPLAAPNL